ncbi:MAG: hypothetical protein IPL99_12440 [Candidatus Competibacteraceae bacterium]|nr:hypothetical protein [Candidatus Competibacteraceae bacterium]
MSALTLYDAIAAQGFATPNEILWDSEIHRFPSDPRKNGKKDGWYIAFEDTRGAGQPRSDPGGRATKNTIGATALAAN